MKQRGFLSGAMFIGSQDVRQLLRERETLIWLLVMPIVFFYFIGTITGGMAQQGTVTEYLALEAPGEAGLLADRLAERLTENGYEVDRANEKGLFRGDRRANEYHRWLVLPEDFTARIERGEASELRLVRREGGLGQDFDQIRALRSVYSLLADLITLRSRNQEFTSENFAALDAEPRNVSLTVKPAGQRQVIPSGFDQAIPGIMVMFVLMQSLSGAAVLLVIERRQGLLRRLASTPITRGQIILGKWLARLAMGVIQVIVGMVYGTLFFNMDWGPDLAMLFLVLLAWAGFCASVGLFVGCVGRTEGQVIGLGIVASMLLAALGGCWWPIEVTPAWMQALAKFLPSGWVMEALHQLVSFQNGPSAALRPLLLMLAGVCVFGYAAVRRFRYT